MQICKDLRMPEEHEYAEKLRRLEKVSQLKMQRDSDSAHVKRPHGSAGGALTHSQSGLQLYGRASPGINFFFTFLFFAIMFLIFYCNCNKLKITNKEKRRFY